VILVDTNVIVDLFKADSQWKAWSEEQLFAASQVNQLTLNAVIYAELCAMPGAVDTVDRLMQDTGIRMEAFSKPAARLAGQAFAKYRKRSGIKTGVLADFFIGAQAQSEGWTILTRDRARYKTYFPEVQLICPP
jgi:predicted nucleic acid-binding protein